MVSSSLALVNVSATVPVSQPSTPNPDPPNGGSSLDWFSDRPKKSLQNPLAQHSLYQSLYQQVLNRLIQGTDRETTARLLQVLARTAFDAGVAQGNGHPVLIAQNPDTATPYTSPHRSPSRATPETQGIGGRSPAVSPKKTIKKSPSKAPLAVAERAKGAPTVLTLEAELWEMEQCNPEAVGLWTATSAHPVNHPNTPYPANAASAKGAPAQKPAPPSHSQKKSATQPSPSSPTVTMSYASASGFPSPFANPFDVPELIGQILIDVPRKVAHPVVWESNPAPRPKRLAKNSPKVGKKRGKVTHHHHHFQVAVDGAGRSRHLTQSDHASRDKEFYDSDSAVFHRSAVPAIAPNPSPTRDQWENHLQTLGQYFRTERRRRGMSLATLSSRTYIPLHHLVSLESGSPQQLPQAIYVKGFIQRIAQDLGLDVNAIMADLPPLPAAAVVPSWLQNQSSTPMAALSLRSWHLYLGYSAVLAGSLAWVAQDLQTSQMPVIEPAPQDATSQSDATPAELSDIDEDLSSLAPPEAIQQ